LRGKGVPRKLGKECVDQACRVALNGLWDGEDGWRCDDWPCDEKGELRLCGRQMSEYALAAARPAVGLRPADAPARGILGRIRFFADACRFLNPV